jgi:hypothetical protein
MLFVVGAEPTWSQVGARLTVTAYDDGRSCPAGCDAHVVFHPQHNGTRAAYRPLDARRPSAGRDKPQRCVSGELCSVCLDPSDSSCIVALYRGGGPAVGRLDVTPAFLAARCGEPGLPTGLSAKCDQHMRAAAQLKSRTNCIANPDLADCRPLMTEAARLKTEDTPRYEQCVRVGERTYNRTQPRALRRTHACAYFANQRHPTGRWLLLTPGACRPGYYVGRSGLDCCSGDPVQAAIDVRECGRFYP